VANFKDFDEALNADKKETLQFKVAGKTYDLPATLPARAVLAQMGMAQEEELTLTSIADWIKSIVGEENFEQMLEDGVAWDQMNSMLEWMLEAYGLVTDENVDTEVDEEEGDNPK
tara:strand:+ start:2620 stop:2964 length:345 start_codon:yes stop_codon:yes gene_type:complete